MALPGRRRRVLALVLTVVAGLAGVVGVHAGALVRAPALYPVVGEPSADGNANYVSSAQCATLTLCAIHPAVGDEGGKPYLVLVVLHGPGPRPGAVWDSYGDTFANLSYCWLHNKLFGHTAIDAATVTIGDPDRYTVDVGLASNSEWVEVAVVGDAGAGDRIDQVSNSCADFTANSPHSTLSATFNASAPGDLGILGWAVINTTALTCSSGTATLVGPCASAVSGPYGVGQSTPALAYETFASAGPQTGTIGISGGGCANTGCPWMFYAVAVASGAPP